MTTRQPLVYTTGTTPRGGLDIVTTPSGAAPEPGPEQTPGGLPVSPPGYVGPQPPQPRHPHGQRRQGVRLYNPQQAAPEDGDYNLDFSPSDSRDQEFRVPIYDAHGHSKNVQVHLHPGYVIEARRVVDSKHFPYRNTSDLIRHALKRHLHWLNQELEKESIGGSILGTVEAGMVLLQEEEIRAEHAENVGKLAAQVGVYVAAGQQERARVLVLRFRATLARIPDEYWRGEYLREIDERFGYLIMGGNGGTGTGTGTDTGGNP